MEAKLPRCGTASDGAVAEVLSGERKLPTATFDTTDFESGRIRELKSERLRIQQKTFKKWINSFLQKSEIQVRILYPGIYGLQMASMAKDAIGKCTISVWRKI